ncbi:MAG: FAD-linked oxidase C-terminal domain-containing protein, partial [Kiloniellales bacterium]|nr:FAD-linked oxidase C-terminal domain-containing protein [Kiloniellales bacterium]
TWYAHASVGCLHVRPVLNMRLDQDVKAMRAIAEEAFDMVLAYKGSHSGEHGDGIVRSEFHEKMFGTRMVENFQEVKEIFDPENLFNPGKIVNAPKMDDKRLFRYGPGYVVPELETALDWSAWPGAGGGFQGAVEMCNNNGACRKLSGGVMCPSYRVTRNEKDLTRGRANTLRLAISGQLGAAALTSDQMAETLKLCVGCKACKRECPTGVDMAKMKIEVAAARAKAGKMTLHERLVAWLPRYAPYAALLPWLPNLHNRVPGLAAWTEGLTGFTSKRKLPQWKRADNPPETYGPGRGKTVILFSDTFNHYFEPENLTAARRVLAAAGFRVLSPKPASHGSLSRNRPLCCGRTFLTNGLIAEAREEAGRLIETYLPFAERGVPIIGLEPSCLLTLRDELPSLLPGSDAGLIAKNAKLFEEFLAEEGPKLSLSPLAGRVLIHGHCHQKAFNLLGSLEATLKMIPDLPVEHIESGCCGMAGAFGYGKETYEISMQMGELGLFEKARSAGEDTLLVANGTSCRHQISDGTGRWALHVARVLEKALADETAARVGHQ